jgi:hypothetical protein
MLFAGLSVSGLVYVAPLVRQMLCVPMPSHIPP